MSHLLTDYSFTTWTVIPSNGAPHFTVRLAEVPCAWDTFDDDSGKRWDVDGIDDYKMTIQASPVKVTPC